MIVLTTLSRLENAHKKKSFIFNIHVELNDPNELSNILDFIRNNNFKIKSVNNDSAYQGSTLTVYTLGLIAKNPRNFIRSSELIKEISKLNGVHFVETL